MDNETKLQKAIDLIVAGEREKGKRILIHLVKKDPTNERAWLCLVKTTEKEDQKMQLVEKVLAIDPHNEIAKKLYAKIHYDHALQSAPQAVDHPAGQTAKPTHQAYNDHDFIDSGYDDVEFDLIGSNQSPASLDQKAETADFDSELNYFDSEYNEPEFNLFSDNPKPQLSDTSEEDLIDSALAFLDSGYQEEAFDFSMSGTGDVGSGSKDQKPADNHLSFSPKQLHSTKAMEQKNESKLAKDMQQLFDTPPPVATMAAVEATSSIDMKMPEKVFEYEASFVLSKGKSTLGRIFSFNMKQKTTRARIKVAPEVELLQIQGIDSLVQNENYMIRFPQIKMLTSEAPNELTFQLVDGREIRLKEIERFDHLTELLHKRVTLKIAHHPRTDSDSRPLQSFS